MGAVGTLDQPSTQLFQLSQHRLQQNNDCINSSSSGGSTSGGSGADAFDALLNDPNVPEEMKEHLRKTREEMKKLQDSVKP